MTGFIDRDQLLLTGQTEVTVPSLHLMVERDEVSRMLCLNKLKIMNDIQSNSIWLYCLTSGNANCVEHLLEQKYVRNMEGNLFSPVHCSV
jgi:hypothetical protein